MVIFVDINISAKIKAIYTEIFGLKNLDVIYLIREMRVR